MKTPLSRTSSPSSSPPPAPSGDSKEEDVNLDAYGLFRRPSPREQGLGIEYSGRMKRKVFLSR